MPRGALIAFRLECGHTVKCHALEPTPTECDQCAVSPEIVVAGAELLPTMKRLKPLRETS